MSVDMSLHIFLDSLDLNALRPVLEAKLADDESLSFVVTGPSQRTGLWVTVFDDTKGVNYYDLGLELSAAAHCRAWEFINQEERWILSRSLDGREVESRERDHHGGGDAMESSGLKLELPDSWDGEVEGARSVSISSDVKWRVVEEQLKPLKVTQTDPALLAPVWKQPSKPALRAACARALTEQGDPRGELISLQLRKRIHRDAQRRIDQLLELYGAVWSAPFKAGSVGAWEGGFPSAVSVRGPVQPAVDHPAWSTVHSLHTTGEGGSLKLLTHASMRHVRLVSGLSVSAVKALAKLGRPLPFVSIGIETADDRVLEHLTAKRFPSLLFVGLMKARSPTVAQVAFMRARPGIEVACFFGHPGSLKDLKKFSAASLTKVARTVEKDLATVEREKAKKVEEKRLPGEVDVKRAVTSGDHLDVVKLLDRSVALDRSKKTLHAAAQWVFGATKSLEFIAASLGPFLHDLELAPDAWLDLAAGGASLDNLAIRDVAARKAIGFSPQRFAALEKRARGSSTRHVRLQALVASLKR